MFGDYVSSVERLKQGEIAIKRVFAVLFLALLFTAVLTSCGSTVPRPEITEGEFPFSVTYEFNGELKTISGVYVCKYNGTSWALDGGSHRDWKGYIKDGNVEEMIEIGTTKSGETVDLNLALCPEYFMGDFVEGYHDVPVPYILVTLADDEGISFLHEADEVEEYCGAKILSYEYAEPIENSFQVLN